MAFNYDRLVLIRPRIPGGAGPRGPYYDFNSLISGALDTFLTCNANVNDPGLKVLVVTSEHFLAQNRLYNNYYYCAGLDTNWFNNDSEIATCYRELRRITAANNNITFIVNAFTKLAQSNVINLNNLKQLWLTDNNYGTITRWRITDADQFESTGLAIVPVR